MNAPAIAQTVGPGGVAAPDLWLESDDAGNVSVAWQDNSANNNPVEAVGSWSLSPADRAHNFHPHTTGYTTTRYFRDATSFIPAGARAESVSIFSAVRRTSANQGRIVGVDDEPTNADEPGFSITTQGFPRFYKFSGGVDSQNFSTAMTLNRSGIAYFISNDLGGTIEIGLDGQSQSRTRNGRQFTVGRSLVVGFGSWANNTPGAFPGDIMEVIWYRRALSAAERDRINSYLAIKHGTTLSSDYLSSSGTAVWSFAAASGFNQNIAGIGLDQASGLHQKQANSINGGDQVIVALGSNVAASNAGNAGAFTVDRSFLMWGDNAGSTSYSNPTTIGATTYNRMARTWRLQQSGTAPQATIAYPYSGTDDVHLIISNTADFSGTNTVVAMPTTQVIEGVAYRTTAAPISFGANTFFTFATSVPDPLVVINTNDTGAGSLREAITFANTQASPVTVSFAIPGAGPHTITLSSVLPNLTANGLTIDGTTQAGTQCRDLWAGNGHDLRINLRGAGFNGLQLAGTSQTIRGLSLTNFDNAIITVAGSSTATIQCNYLGLLANGTSSANSRGVLVRGASARIGGLDAGQGNVLSANSIVGVVTEQGSTDTAIRGNFFGTDTAGMTARANNTAINNFNGTATWRDITRNLISGNTAAGIVLETDDQIGPSTDLVRIQRNVIGFTRDLSALMRNGGDGIRFPSGSIANVLIGGLASAEGNTITGTSQGISLNNTPNIFIRGNVIARSGQNGVRITAANGVTIGGDSATLGNVIGGNGFSGIAAIDGTSNITILGNTIGAVTITGGTFENQDRGIFLRNVSNVTIGDGTTGGRNVIARNGLQAIMGTGTASGIAINGNTIGTDATGNTATANGARLMAALRDAITFQEGGTFASLAIRNNVIGGHEGALIKLADSTATGVIIRGNAIGVGADGVSPIVAGNGNSLIAIGGGPLDYANVEIGGPDAGDGNVIAFGGQNGITVNTVQTGNRIIGNTIRNNSGNGILLLDSTRVAIISNRIFGNGLLGIELGLDGVTPNDPGDGDSGPNDLLNFPDAIRAVVTGPAQIRYTFTLDALAATSGYRVEFFASAAADPSGFGEGERFLGHVDIAHGGGLQSYSGTFTTLEPIGIGDTISATTTRRTAGGGWDITSEFSAVATADGVAALTVAVASEVFDPSAANPFATPGNDILLTTTVSNNGNGSTDADSLFVAIAISPDTAFFNDVTPALGGVVGFATAAPALTFTPGTDLRFSNSAAAPVSFAQCNYSPAAGYDPQVRHVCINPEGTLPSGSPQGQFAVQLRARIN